MWMHNPVATNSILAVNYWTDSLNVFICWTNLISANDKIRFVQHISCECSHSVGSVVRQTLGTSLGIITLSCVSWRKLLSFSFPPFPRAQMEENKGFVMIKWDTVYNIFSTMSSTWWAFKKCYLLVLRAMHRGEG